MNSEPNGMNVNAVSDSDVLIDWFRGHPEAAAAFATYDRVMISRITWIEVLVGAATAESEAFTRRILSAFTIIDISDAIAEEAVLLRRRSRLKLPDAIILATAKVHGCVLLTRNTRDFEASDANVSIPYRLS